MENIRGTDWSVFNFSWKTASIRYGVIFVLAVTNAHLRYGKMPFSLGYEFPGSAFLSVALFGVVICSASWIVTWFIRYPIFKNGIGWASIYRFLLVNVLVAILVYSVLYILAFGVPVGWLNFSAYLFVTLAIVIIENLLFVLYTLYRSGHEMDNKKYQSEKLTIPMGNRQLRVDVSDILMVELEEGIVCIHQQNSNKLRTQFQTLDQVQALLPSQIFYRANRKTLLSREAVSEVLNDHNRKARVVVKRAGGYSEVPISRYKKKELLGWVNQ
ncbi:MAG: LytTR family transcriptional regulator DNA-binding domain-containing protein [Cyclobacteriaceae bacterium]